jgi:hypothetical protein
MRLRVVRCPEDAHDLPWVDADACEHWPRKCQGSKRAKHKLRTSEPGFLVGVTGIPPEGWQYDYDPPEWALEVTTKHYAGSWRRDPANHLTDALGHGGAFVPAPRGFLIRCSNCDLTGAL